MTTLDQSEASIYLEKVEVLEEKFSCFSGSGSTLPLWALHLKCQIIRPKSSGHVTCLSFHLLSSPPSLVSQMPWPLYSHLSSLRSLLQHSPIRCQYSGHMTFLDQSEVSIKVTLRIPTNQRSVFRSRDLSSPAATPLTPLGRMYIMTEISTNEKLVFRSKDQY